MYYNKNIFHQIAGLNGLSGQLATPTASRRGGVGVLVALGSPVLALTTK